jgi:hypothetical protein
MEIWNNVGVGNNKRETDSPLFGPSPNPKWGLRRERSEKQGNDSSPRPALSPLKNCIMRGRVRVTVAREKIGQKRYLLPVPHTPACIVGNNGEKQSDGEGRNECCERKAK